jgi:glutamine amidotransferase
LRAEPARYRVSVPMWTDESFASIAGVVASGCVLAGVRSASIGMPVEASATAPFTADRVLFGHNGFVPDAAALRRLLPPGLVPESRVDSALLWTLVQARSAEGRSLPEALARVVRDVSACTEGRLNLFAADGSTVAATSWGDTLWVQEGPDGVLVASEPSDEADGAAADGWRELPDRTLLAVEQAGITVSGLDGPDLKGAA